MKQCLLVFAAVVALAVGVPASAQYMYLDVNGDGACTSADVLTTGTTSVDVWLRTAHNKNGGVATCPTGEQLTINSYTFILSAPTGGVTYGAWTDNLGYTINANVCADGTCRAGNDVWVAKASGVISPPGDYKCGSLAITVASNGAYLEIHNVSSIDAVAITSFGSACPGKEFDNTMKYDPAATPTSATGDWTDVCGTASGVPVTETTWGKIKANYSH